MARWTQNTAEEQHLAKMVWVMCGGIVYLKLHDDETVEGFAQGGDARNTRNEPGRITYKAHVDLVLLDGSKRQVDLLDIATAMKGSAAREQAFVDAGIIQVVDLPLP